MPLNPSVTTYDLTTDWVRVAANNPRRVAIIFGGQHSQTLLCYLSPYPLDSPDTGLGFLMEGREFKRCDFGPLVQGEWHARMPSGTLTITVVEIYELQPG